MDFIEINAANKITQWWKNILEFREQENQDWGKDLEQNHLCSYYYDEDEYYNILYNPQEDENCYYDDDGCFYDHSKTHEIFGSTLNAREYTDYILANTREDGPDDREYFTTTEEWQDSKLL